MEEDKKWTIWFKIWIAIEALVGLFAIWVICTLFSILLTMGVMKIRFGECTFKLMDEYSKYIQSGYIVILGLCIARYVHYLYNKYKIKE